MEHKKWEYLILLRHKQVLSISQLEEWLNYVGKDGWELSGINGTEYIFKRPILTQPEQ